MVNPLRVRPEILKLSTHLVLSNTRKTRLLSRILTRQIRSYEAGRDRVKLSRIRVIPHGVELYPSPTIDAASGQKAKQSFAVKEPREMGESRSWSAVAKTTLGVYRDLLQ